MHKGWSRPLDDPIALSNGHTLRTLRDAGHHVTALPKADQAKPHWQTAAHEPIMATALTRGSTRVCQRSD
jgi:hypothetical protein